MCFILNRGKHSNRFDYGDTFNFIDLVSFSPNKPLTLEVIHSNGISQNILLNHTYNQQQIDWFKAGSALNLIRKNNS